MRDDSGLYSGISSVSLEKQRFDRERRKDETRDTQRVLTPAGEIIHAKITREIEDVLSVKNIDVEKFTDERTFMAEIMARKKYVAYLESLRTQLSNALKDRA